MTHVRTRLAVVAIAALAFLAFGSAAGADEKIAKEEGLVCTSCHDKPGSKLLTDLGKYYELMGSQEGFSEVKATFDRCTSCHVRKPGSHKLTKRGKKFAFVVSDMKGLKRWVQSEHPGSTELAAETADEKDNE